MNHKNIFSYYRDCYKEDSADLNLWNLNKLKRADRFILQGQDDLGCGFLSRLPIPEAFAEPMMKQVEIYQRERVLLYVSFMLVGKLDIKGEEKQVVSPLLYNEAVIEKEADCYYFSVNSQTPEVNESLVQVLMPEGDRQPNMAYSDRIQSPALWTSFLKNSPLQLDLLSLLRFPKLSTSSDIKKALKASSPTLLPVSMLVFVERSVSSRGVIHELDEIIEGENFSKPLLNLASAQHQQNQSIPVKYDYLPGLLSTPQKKIISIAANADLGCVSGPPGTGKSYTIAAVAAEHMARGQSVLIVANNDVALDVIAEKLATNFGLNDVSLRAGQKAFLKKLKSYIADLLAGYLTEEELKEPKEIESELKLLNHSLGLLETKFVKFCHKAIIRGQRLRRVEQKNMQWLKRFYLAIAGRGIRELSQHWRALDEINLQLINREALASDYLNILKNKNLRTFVESNRKSLQAFNKAIRSRTSKRQFELFSDIEFSALLSAFPIWLVSLNTLYRVLPLQKELFDLVIIDEATQCNISSCIPALYRAKRALIVGDTKQLRHYSFLAKSKELQLMAKNNISASEEGVMSYRENAILDLTLNALSSQKQLAFLDEHFRSKPELIHFSNQQFYQNKLKVMQHRPSTSSGHLHVHRINGFRDKFGVNRIEAGEVIATIQRIISEQMTAGIEHSIGVISPFRNQADYIAKEIAITFSESVITQYKIRVATPYGFQGEERDIMLISFSLDNESKRAAAYLNKADVFNVAITRARQQQYLFISLNEKQLPEHNLLRLYLSSINTYQINHSMSPSIDDFQRCVTADLNNHNIETWLGYAIAGIDIDVLCCYQGQYLALDLIGYPGPWADYFEFNTYKLFKRAGVDVLPISYGLWVTDKASCLREIMNKLNISI
ncbi:DEAD/DEAH box helicase [Psychromonas sp. PT13]|uniref:DEAD/DEAH box helicase n=1 Tax=Psychromonas sp. PT13 TaxID=3439547 RepID=UPI003EBE5CDE